MIYLLKLLLHICYQPNLKDNESIDFNKIDEGIISKL